MLASPGPSGSWKASSRSINAWIYQLARRLALLCDVAGGEEDAITYYEKAIHAGGQIENVIHSDLGTLLNNVALIYRRSGRQKAAEPYYHARARAL